MTWLHVTNTTGAEMTLYLLGGTYRIAPGRWCLSSGDTPHCQPKEKP